MDFRNQIHALVFNPRGVDPYLVGVQEMNLISKFKCMTCGHITFADWVDKDFDYIRCQKVGCDGLMRLEGSREIDLSKGKGGGLKATKFHFKWLLLLSGWVFLMFGCNLYQYKQANYTDLHRRVAELERKTK